MSAREILSFLEWTGNPMGYGHMLAGLVSVAIGPVVFFRRKGTRSHRILGYIYVVLMLGVNVSALTMYDFTGGPNLFHVFAIISLGTITPGIFCAVRARMTGSPRAVEAHYYWMSWSYFGLLAAFVSQIGSRVDLGQWAFGLSIFSLIGMAMFPLALIANWLIRGQADRVLPRYQSDV